MKTEVIGVRLPVEQVATLQKMANSRGLKVSDLVREMVNQGVETAKTGADINGQILAKIKEAEQNILGGQTWIADVLVTEMRAVAAARYLAQIAADNSDEVINYLANQKPLDAKTKRQWQEKRALEEEKQGDKWVARAMEIASQETE